MSELTMKQIQQMVFGDMKYAFAEPGHPGYHLTAASHAVLDFWGLMQYRGLYHILCHVSPRRGKFQDDTVFFHFTSPNLIDWEMLPVPIEPLDDELRMNDGCICFDGDETPVMLYTKVWKDVDRPRVHCAAHALQDMRRFERRTSEAFLTLENHGGPDFAGGWSDPYVFRADGRTFMLMSKCVTPDGTNRMPVYEAVDDSMLHWEYKGIFFEDNGEVVSFFRLGEKWVLTYSPYDMPEYFVGDFDIETLKFIPQTHGYVSYGYHGKFDGIDDRGFYAHCTWQDEKRTIFAGWISGFRNTVYWDGCMSIPREVGLNDRMQLTQKPIAEFDSLLGECLADREEITESFSFQAQTDMLDIRFDWSEEGEVRLSLFGESGRAFELRIKGDTFWLNGEAFTGALADTGRKVRLLIDCSFCELFFGDGAVCATRCFTYIGRKPQIVLSCRAGACVSDFICRTVKPCTITVDEEVRQYL